MNAHPSGGSPALRTIMPGRDIVVIGASAGGVEALRALVAALPADFSPAVFIVLHRRPDSPSLLVPILKTVTTLPVLSPADGAEISFGTICIAPPDHHLLLEPTKVRLSRGPAENRHRPAIDPLFRSAALSFGPRVVGVILTGNLDDGSAGLRAVKQSGGVAVVQDPADALAPDMPRNALAHVAVDHCLPLREIPPLLQTLSRESLQAAESSPATPALVLENAFASLEPGDKEMAQLGKLSSFTCPSCSGSLWEVHDGNLIRYRCHVGHGFTIRTLSAELSKDIENALYSALRAMQDKASALRKLALRLGETMPRAGEEYELKAQAQERDAEVIRQLIAGLPAESEETGQRGEAGSGGEPS